MTQEGWEKWLVNLVLDQWAQKKRKEQEEQERLAAISPDFPLPQITTVQIQVPEPKCVAPEPMCSCNDCLIKNHKTRALEESYHENQRANSNFYWG